jgi:hypothetical protein
MKTSRGLLAALLGAGMLAVLPSAAHASPPTETKTIQVTSEFTEPVSSFDGAGCTLAVPDCYAIEQGTTTYTGTLAGVSQWEITGRMGSDGQYHFKGVHKFADATIDGCGRGGLEIDIDGSIAPQPDPASPLVGVEKWSIRPGRGTGGLSSLTGGAGDGEFAFHIAELGGEKWVQGTLTGAVTCHVPMNGHAPQKPKTEIRTIQVRADYTEPQSSVDGVQCRGLAGMPLAPDCRGRVVGPVSFTGSIEGDAYYDLTGPTRDGYHYEGQNHFEDAVIEGCGRGAFDLVDHQGELLLAKYDPVTNTLPGYNTWTVANGRRGLSGLISGQGENHWTIYWSETGTERWGRGTFTGTITCEVPTHSARADDKTDDPSAAVRGASYTPASAAAVEAGLPATGASPTLAVAGAAGFGLTLAARRARRARLGS